MGGAMASNAVTSTKGKANRRPLILASLFGALSAILILTYLQSQKGSDKNQASGAVVPVVFALRDIPERTQIKEGMLEVKIIPVEGAHAQHVASKDVLIDKVTRVPIAAGDQLTSTKVAGEIKDVGFSAVVPDGKRAVAVGVTEVIATGGHISPGDYVDVIAVFEVGGESAGKGGGSGLPNFSGGGVKQFMSATILQRVQVLAVAQRSDPTIPEKGKNAGATPEDAKARSVTLAVTPEEAEKLFLGEEMGKIRLSLRGFADDEQRKIAPVFNSIEDILGR